MNKTTGKSSLWLMTAISIIFLFTCGTFAQEQVSPSERLQPVLLIHGLGCTAESWGELPDILRNRGYEVFVLDFNEWTWLDNAKDSEMLLADLCTVLARQLERIVVKTNRLRVNVIAHSFGGIIVRAYIAGWGIAVTQAAGYNDDINKVIYLATPNFGSELSGSLKDKLIEGTDYGPFKNGDVISRTIDYASDELIQLNQYFIDNAQYIKVQPLTVSSIKDKFVPGYSANLDTYINIGSKGAGNSETPNKKSKHIYLKNYKHASSSLIADSTKSMINVTGPDHPVARVAISYFGGTDKWMKVGAKAKNKESFLAFDFQPGNGFSPKGLGKKDVVLKAFVNDKKKKKVKLYQNPESDAFYATGVKSGKYELTLPIGKQKVAFKFMVTVAEGSGAIVKFNPDFPPEDPDDPDEPDNPDEPDKPDDLPESIDNINDLRAFIRLSFPLEYDVYKTPDQLLDFSRRIRDAVASIYSSIERCNDQAGRFDYTAAYEKHADAFYVVSTNSVIDFISSATDGGVLKDKLHWIRVQPPW